MVELPPLVGKTGSPTEEPPPPPPAPTTVTFIVVMPAGIVKVDEDVTTDIAENPGTVPTKPPVALTVPANVAFCDESKVSAVVALAPVFSTNAPVVSPVLTSAVPVAVPAEIELISYPLTVRPSVDHYRP
jgi:hypothetical protein